MNGTGGLLVKRILGLLLLLLPIGCLASECGYVFGIGRFAQPNPNQEIVVPTVSVIKSLFGEGRVCVRSFSTKDLEDAINAGELDFFISSSGLYRRVVQNGVRDAAAVFGGHVRDPNHAEGTLFITNASAYEADTFAQFRGGVLAAGIPAGFTGYLAGIYELKKQGVDAKAFFSRIDFVGADQSQVLERLLSGRADLGMMRTCMYESILQRRPELAGRFRVINEKHFGDFACRHSSNLYPSWIFGVSKSIDAETATRVTTALLKMRPTQSGLNWGIATDFSEVDAVMKELSLGPFHVTDKWFVSNLWSRYQSLILIALGLVLVLAAHSWRSNWLVQKRTRELNEVHEHEDRLERERNQANQRILEMQRIGVVGQFSSLLVHELGQPNAANQLLIHALKRSMEHGAPTMAFIESMLGKIQSNVTREQRLIEKIRKYAKSPAASKSEVDLTEAARSAIDIVAKSLKASIRVEARLPEKALLLRGDELELEILLVNLIKNAAEAQAGISDTPGILVEVSASSPGFACVRVIDNGPRRSDEEIRNLFEPLKSTKPEGLGLGLYICRMIAEKYKGDVKFERAGESGGICATVKLPV